MQNIISLDEKVFYFFNSIVGENSFLDFIVKILAVYVVYLVPIIFLICWFYPTSPRLRGASEKTQKFLIEMLAASVISWQVIARVVGVLINRPRPEAFAGTKELLFHPPTYAFPSDHALFLMFLTTYLYLYGYKKWGNIALFLTIVVSISRVIAGFHWPGDVLAGWVIGGMLAYLFYSIRKYIEKYIVNPLYWLAKKVKLI